MTSKIFPYLLVLLLLVASCHSGTNPQPINASQSPQATSSPAVQSQPAATDKSPAREKKADTAAATQTQKGASNEALDQLDFESEGGSRGLGFVMMVHVVHAAKPVRNAVVGAVNQKNRLAAKAYTDARGNASLSLDEGDYRLVAKRGKLYAERSITFAAGDKFTIDLQ